MTTTEILAEMSRIRKAMAAALRERPKNIALHDQLAAEHRRLMKQNYPSMYAAWKAQVLKTYGKIPEYLRD
jgi:hypothetical protein